MPFSLTNPGLEYPQDDFSVRSLLKFFKNPALRSQQYAQDASQAVQPSTSTVEGSIGEPSVSMGREMLPGPVDASVPDFEYSPGQDQTTVGMQSPRVGILPKFIKPRFADTLTTPEGLPALINPAQTKLGKLLAVVRAVTEGGLAGASGGNFGEGFQIAQTAPFQRAMRNQQVESGQLQNQAQRANIAMLPWKRAAQIAELLKTQAEARKARYTDPRSGGVYDLQTGTYAPGAGPTQLKDPVEQRRSFADDHPDMFENDHEKNNFVLYGHEPKVATTNPNEWQLRLAAASGDAHAQAVLDQRFREEKTLAGIRGRTSADNRASKEQDAADAEQIASTILNAARGDPDKALKLFDQHSGKITDPDQRRLGPSIRKAIRARRQINKPQSALDKIISGDVEGGLNDMQEVPTQQR
jgi:hypothetical protein